MHNDEIVAITKLIMEKEDFLDISKLCYFSDIVKDEDINLEIMPLAFFYSPEKHKYVMSVNALKVNSYIKNLSEDLKIEVGEIISKKIVDSMMRALEDKIKVENNSKIDLILNNKLYSDIKEELQNP